MNTVHILAGSLVALFLAGAVGRADEKKDDGAKECKPWQPKTLVQLAMGPRPSLDDDDEEDEEKEEPLVGDRPDFVESSANVGRGRIELEAGYTYMRDRSDGQTTHSHSQPEVLLRIGLFADWLELRVGQNFGVQNMTGRGVRGSDSGAEDLYLGIGLALTLQKGLIPESRIVLQTTAPTGAHAFTGDEWLPGVNILYGWEVIPDRLSLGMSTSINRARDDAGAGAFYLEFAQAATTGITLTEKLGMYLEVFGIFASGSVAPETGPQYYADGGFMYHVTNNLQLDIRAGVGLNRRSDDFFVGSGFVVRY